MIKSIIKNFSKIVKSEVTFTKVSKVPIQKYSFQMICNNDKPMFVCVWGGGGDGWGGGGLLEGGLLEGGA